MKQKQFEPLVYWTSKLSHNGITSYKQFEHCGRRMHNIPSQSRADGYTH